MEAEFERMVDHFAPTQDLQEEAFVSQALVEGRIQFQAAPEAEAEAEAEAELETETDTEDEVPAFAELDAHMQVDADLMAEARAAAEAEAMAMAEVDADVAAFADALGEAEGETEAETEVEAEDTPAANTTATTAAANTTAATKPAGSSSKVIKLKEMQGFDELGFRGATEERDKVLADCNGCTATNGTAPEFGTTSTGLPCRCEEARRARRRLYVRQIARQVSKNTTESLIKQYAPKLYKRVLSLAKKAKITTDVFSAAMDSLQNQTVSKPGEIPTVDPLAVRDAAIRAANQSAQQVLLKTGLTNIDQKNEKNFRIQVETAKRIIGEAVQAGIRAGEKIAQKPVDAIPDTFLPNNTKPAVPGLPGNNNNTAALVESEVEAEVETEVEAETEAEVEAEAETEAEVEDTPAATPAATAAPAPPAPPAPNATQTSNQTMAGVSDSERQLLIQKWMNEAAAAPADQKLWEVFQDPKGDQYYYNVITKETTWKPPSPIDQMKRARDFNAETDVPPSWQVWQNNYITPVPEGQKPQRDWCNPYLCKNGRPCINGACQCGLMWEGPMCETPSQLARDLRFKELQSSKVVSFAEIERQKELAEEEAREKADLAARNVSTEFMPQPAIVAEANLMESSVLGPDGLVNRRDIEGPTLVRGLMPSVVGQADEAMVFYGSPLKLELLNQDPTRIRLARKLNFKAQIDRPKRYQVIGKGSAGLPGVPKVIHDRYIKTEEKPEYNPIYGEIRGFEIKNPDPAEAQQPQVIEFNSNEAD